MCVCVCVCVCVRVRVCDYNPAKSTHVCEIFIIVMLRLVTRIYTATSISKDSDFFVIVYQMCVRYHLNLKLKFPNLKK